ncbi:glycosyltransferase family 4 protein [Flavobacterium aciduliphilum]|uniref:Glycosyltransferase involved in cell wall biosynthesis n=1 Tax=Flavobacterium aciduliphilum TaxID=1101402 RepID=A0A328Y836_9FLAO|nr:glycosyltransferase family 4 protein [Flavobacterium aciduliphilum]RAR70241.1 glycosyltransferase involved in cell wall biosynthesis [Flavobacterium aciduliphilum]
MKLLYLHQYFVTPDEYGATRSYWFAKKMVDEGYQVTVITALTSFTKRTKGIHDIDGIKVIYLGGRYSNTQSKFRKILNFLRYFFGALFSVLKEKKVSLIYATSTPLTVGFIALIVKKICKVKYIFEVRDLWPEFPIQIGVIRNKCFINLLRTIERSIYKNAIHIVALSPGMEEGILDAGVEKNKVTVIPNMSKPDLFYPRGKNKELMCDMGIREDNFNIIHFGSMGVANGLEYLIDVAKILKDKSVNDVNIIFAGYGQTESKLKNIVNEEDLKNVLFVGKHNTFVISEIVNCCDASCVSFKNLKILQTNSPNKLFDSLSAGKPIIVNSSGWTKDLVESHFCGLYVNPDDPNDFVDKIVSLKNNDKRIDEMSKNSRRLALEVFDKEILAKQFLEIVMKYFKQNI